MVEPSLFLWYGKDAIGFGLGITMSDFNGDLWPDLFISNDFFEKDYLYLNNYIWLDLFTNWYFCIGSSFW